MKVVIDNKVYDSAKEPILLILSDADRENIAKLDSNKLLSYPTGMDDKAADAILDKEYEDR